MNGFQPNLVVPKIFFLWHVLFSAGFTLSLFVHLLLLLPVAFSPQAAFTVGIKDLCNEKVITVFISIVITQLASHSRINSNNFLADSGSVFAFN